MGEILSFNASAEHLDTGKQRLAFFELAGFLDIKPEDGQLKGVFKVPVTLAASEANRQVTLPGGLTTGKLLCIKTTDNITVKRDSTGGEAWPVNKWTAEKPGGGILSTTFTSIYLTNTVAKETKVELLIGGL